MMIGWALQVHLSLRRRIALHGKRLGRAKPRVGRGIEVRQDAIAVFSMTSAGVTLAGAPHEPAFTSPVARSCETTGAPRPATAVDHVGRIWAAFRLTEGAWAGFQRRASGESDRRFRAGTAVTVPSELCHTHRCRGLRQHDG